MMLRLVLVVLVAIGAAAAAYPWMNPVQATALPPPRQAKLPSLDIPPLPALLSLNQTRDRPLFTPLRRIEAPIDQTGMTLEDAAKPLILGRYAKTGFVISGDRRILLLRDTVEGGAVRVLEGERLDDWLIEVVGFDKLVLRKGGETLTFAMDQEE